MSEIGSRLNHNKFAARLLPTLGLRAMPSEMLINCRRTTIPIVWDAVGDHDGKVFFVEVEPADADEVHIRGHVTNLALLSHQLENIGGLIWTVYSDAPSCHLRLKSYAESWGMGLEDMTGEPLPPMSYHCRTGRKL